MKNKMSFEKKAKLIYSGELILIALVVLVIGILKLVGVMATKETRLLVYNIITIIGASFFLANFIWALFSPRKRKKSCMLDNLLNLPALLYILAFDIYCFVIGKGNIDDTVVKYSVGLILIYIAVDYIFQGIYHYFYPTPQLLEAMKEDEKKEELTSNNDIDTELPSKTEESEEK